VRVIGLTLSAEQKAFTDSRGWRNFQSVLSDWRTYDSGEKFDAIVSIESLEHYASMEDRRNNVHVNVYREFFEKCSSLSSNIAPLYVQSSIARANPTDLQGYKDARYIVERVFAGSALATIASLQAAAYPRYEFTELLLRPADMISTIDEWRRSLVAKEVEIVQEHGSEIFKFFREYFDAAIRRFEAGGVDLLELTLSKARLS
jgi:cyclopropane-fatty-acyl-phospholipid synthase